jgi:hypothetical protein
MLQCKYMPKKKPVPRWRSGCPLNASVEMLCDRWQLRIVRDMMLRGKCNPFNGETIPCGAPSRTFRVTCPRAAIFAQTLFDFLRDPL